MPEFDLLMMSAVIFAPSLFALGLLFFPRGTDEWMRWWSLLGTAVTLVLSLCVFISYHQMLDFDIAHPQNSSLIKRHDDAAARQVNENPKMTGVRLSGDCIGWPVIRGFHGSISTTTSASTASAWR